jgi:DNA-directed RNA polymerase specialized sigma24 family protein
MDITTAELRIAGSVAAKIGKRWEQVEIDDVTSHLYLWLVENYGAVSRWRAEEGGEGKLYVSLRREAAKFCAHESAARINRPLDHAAAYPVEVLERGLPFIWEDTPVTEVKVNPVTGQEIDPPSETGLAQAILADIRGGFYGLPGEVREVLAWRFRDGLTYEEIGELSAMTKDGAKKRVARGLKRLSDALGTEA